MDGLWQPFWWWGQHVGSSYHGRAWHGFCLIDNTQKDHHTQRLLVSPHFFHSSQTLTQSKTESKPYLQKARCPGISGGYNKFCDPKSIYIPHIVQVWADALAEVDTSPEHLIEQNKTDLCFGHYALPDPTLFVTLADDMKKLAFLLMWLCACPALLYCLKRQQMTALSNQAWRDFLEMGHSDKQRNDTAAAAHQEEICKMIGGVLKTPGESGASSNANLGPVHWEGKELAYDKLPRMSMVWKILWEIYELNFCVELSSLNQRASTEPMDTASCIQRLWSCFPDTNFPFVKILYVDTGLIAKNWRGRLPFILAFMNMMFHWRRSKPTVLDSRLRCPDEFSHDQALELEHKAAQFYMQTFFNHFGRASLIPHCILPAIWLLLFFFLSFGQSHHPVSWSGGAKEM